MPDEHREEACLAVPVPADIARHLDGYRWARDLVGESGGAVYRLHGHAGAPDLFLKHGSGAVADDITDEMTRLLWLARYVAVPEVRQFVRGSSDAWLLMTAIPGKTAWQLMAAHPERRLVVVDRLAHFLRQIHAIPVDQCPFTSTHVHRLAAARVRIDAGLVDEDGFDAPRQGWSAVAVWEALQDLVPLASDPVVTHGDYSLDNILVGDGEEIACIDAGRVGIADRYQDLAIAWNCMGEFGVAYQARFLAQYGVADLDRNKLDFHLMLDELF